MYKLDISILLKPIGTPSGRITLGKETLDVILLHERSFEFRFEGTGDTVLQIEHYGKLDNDPDTAIVIEQIKFDSIYSPKFAWAGVYTPLYPKHISGPSNVSPQTYLSWNGTWRLDFSLPIYTWIHQIEGLGWIYD